MTENQAFEILKKYTTKPNLIKHAFCVSACMKHFAKLENKDQEFWAVAGMLHDIDFEMYPEQHCYKCVELLKENGLDDKTIHAIQSHGWEIVTDNEWCTSVEPNCYMEKVLSAVDQLSGLIIAVALMKDRKLANVTLESIKNKWKNKNFASGTDRDRIVRFCERMGKDFDYVATQTLIALQGISNKLEL